MTRREFCFTAEDINATVEQIRAYFTGRKIPKEDVIKQTLLIEEALLRYRDRFGEAGRATLVTTDFVITKATIRVKGEEFNPLEDESSDPGILGSPFFENLLENKTTATVYHRHFGYNEIIAIARREPKTPKLPGGAVTIGALLAAIAAVLSQYLPEAVSGFLLNELAVPLFSSLMGLIVLVTGPLIFASVISSICALGDVATLSSLGLRVIRRFLMITIMMIVFSIAVSLLFFPGISPSASGAFDLSMLVRLFLDLIPQDLFSPFAEGKSIQIIVIAVITGVAILMLDEKAQGIKSLVPEVNRLLFIIMELVSKIIPLTVFLSIYKAACQNSPENILTVWKLVLANFAIMLPFTALMVLFVCFRRHLDVRQFLRNISPPAILAFTTCSGTLAMTKQFETAKNVMKKDPRLVDFWVPLSQAMFAPAVIPALVAGAFFAGSFNGTPLSLSQILILFILVTQLSIASPKVPGGIMATFSILLAQLGLPEDIVGLLMIANVFVANAETGLAMIIRSTELEEFSHVVEDEKLAMNPEE